MTKEEERISGSAFIKHRSGIILRANSAHSNRRRQGKEISRKPGDDRSIWLSRLIAANKTLLENSRPTTLSENSWPKTISPEKLKFTKLIGCEYSNHRFLKRLSTIGANICSQVFVCTVKLRFNGSWVNGNWWFDKKLLINLSVNNWVSDWKTDGQFFRCIQPLIQGWSNDCPKIMSL